MSDTDVHPHKYGRPTVRGAGETSMPIGRREPRTPAARVPADPAGASTNPYPSPVAAPPPGDDPQPAAEPVGQAAPHPELPPPPRLPERWLNPVAQWWHACRDDSAQRKDRGQGRRWAMRWMGEQPTSVADHVDYYLHQRDERPDGRRGWGLRTGAPIINGPHAVLYRAYGLSVGLAVTLAAYALGWMCQRPGRAFLLAIGLVIVKSNLSAWLAGPGS